MSFRYGHQARLGMKFQNILYEEKKGAAIIKFNRPEKKNAISLKLTEELREALKDAESDSKVRLVVLTGVGDSFSSGADFSDPQRTMEMIRQSFDVYSGKSAMLKLINLEKPTVAAVNGHALGHGVEYALMCDIIVASDKAVFGFIGPYRGVTCPYAMIRLADEVGRAKAKELILTCERISAEEALRIGLINKVVPHEKLMDAVFEIFEKMKRASPLAIRMTKEAINRGLGGYGYSLKKFEEIIGSRDALEGAMAFIEKREPRWE